MNPEELRITADLAEIELTAQEEEELRRDVGQMVEYFALMLEVDVEGLEPTTHALLDRNRTREDVAESYEGLDDVMENVPEAEDRFIVIPNVL